MLSQRLQRGLTNNDDDILHPLWMAMISLFPKYIVSCHSRLHRFVQMEEGKKRLVLPFACCGGRLHVLRIKQ